LPRERTHGIKSFFEPRSIAVAGVSTDPDKLGSIIFTNLIENYRKGLLKAQVYALNPAHNKIGDQPCYPSVGALPEVPELMIVAVPESQTIPLISEASNSGVQAAVIITGGYAEAGRGDVEKKIGKIAARHGMRVLGPNTIGLVDTSSGVDSLFLRPTKNLPDGSQIVSMLNPLPGGVAIITQSGHLGEIVSEELAANGVGIRALVGTGNQLDVSIEDVTQYFADDPNTRVIVAYLEGLRDGRQFMRVAALATRKKPIVVLKVGKTEVGARAALTHTASLVGDYEVYRAAFSHAGVVEAHGLQELVDSAISLSMLPRVKGKRLAIVTNAGGVGAIAADEAEESGLKVEPLGDEAVRALRSEFAGAGFISNASLGNPIDLTASVTTDEFVKVTDQILALPEIDLVVLLPTHHAPGITADIAGRLSVAVKKARKPVAVGVIGSSPLAGRIHGEFLSNGIPSFPTPERAVRALAAMTSYVELREKARGPADVRPRTTRTFGRMEGPLPHADVAALLNSYGIRSPRSVVVHSSKDFGLLEAPRYPVVCKLLSGDLLHKTEAGGVVLGVSDAANAKGVFSRFVKIARRRRVSFDGMMVQETVDKGVELLLGGTRDPTFGPVVLVGLGGTYAELMRDYTLAIAPVSPGEAETMVGRGRLGQVIGGYRGGPKVRADRLAKVVSGFSRIMAENPRIEQMEINPLMAGEDAILSVDARVLLRRDRDQGQVGGLRAKP